MAQHFKLSSNWRIILRDLGLRPGDVLRRAGLPTDLFAREIASVSAEEYFRLWRGLEEEMGDRPMALEVGQGVSVEAFDPPIFAALCSPDLNTAAERLSKFKRLMGPLALDVNIGTEQSLGIWKPGGRPTPGLSWNDRACLPCPVRPTGHADTTTTATGHDA